MFTGIIEEKGTIKNIDKKKNLSRISIEAKLSGVLQIGDSIAVDGTCLTVVEKKSNVFIAEAIKQTLEITTLKDKKAGEIVNLETSLTLNKSLSGHIVQGHIDTVGALKAIKKLTWSLAYVNIRNPRIACLFLVGILNKSTEIRDDGSLQFCFCCFHKR